VSPAESLDWVDGWFESRIRVRYPEVDPQGVVHHSVYLHYFEHGRTEMLRTLGVPYREIEEQGTRLMVVESRLRHHAAAGYDEVLRVRTRAARITRVRIFLEYLVLRIESGKPICEGATVLAAVDPSGKPKPLPSRLLERLTAVNRGSSPAPS
jgi:acyl-CoA thioester hydrolase